MHWTQFADRLAQTLTGLDEDDAIIVSWRACESVYLQFLHQGAALAFEVVDDQFLPDDRKLGPAGRHAMAALGWAVEHPGFDNWHRDVPLPLSPDDAGRAAASAVATLRDVFGVPAPDELDYKAFGRVPDLRLPGLGLRRAGEAAVEAPAAPATPAAEAGPAPSPARAFTYFLADSYDALPGWDRPPMVYALRGEPSGVAALTQGRAEHPLALLRALYDQPEHRATFAAAVALAIATESWTYSREVMDELMRRRRDDPTFDHLAFFGPPSQRPDRVELSSVTVCFRGGPHALLTRPRHAGTATSDYLCTEDGATVSGEIVDHLTAVLRATG